VSVLSADGVSICRGWLLTRADRVKKATTRI
jgi:hypothetical protein